MKCPQCDHKMLKFPVCKPLSIMEFWLCINCVPHVHVLIHCKWKKDKVCTHPNSFGDCNLSTERCGFNWCPQIREWIEYKDWVKGKNQKWYDLIDTVLNNPNL